MLYTITIYYTQDIKQIHSKTNNCESNFLRYNSNLQRRSARGKKRGIACAREEEEKNRLELEKAKSKAYSLRSELLQLQQESYDSTFAETIELLLIQIEQEEEEKGETWSARLKDLNHQKEEAESHRWICREQGESR